VELLDRVHEPAIRYAGCGCVPELTEDRKDAVYRIAQEAIHNALRHAGASRIDIVLTEDGGATVLRVTDDGVGFAAADGRGLGLESMGDRAREAGGTLTVTSEPGAGTTVRLVVPT
jgi:signal transduction histidine kinase